MCWARMRLQFGYGLGQSLISLSPCIYVNTKLNSGTTAYTIPEACFSNIDLLDQNVDPDINK